MKFIDESSPAAAPKPSMFLHGLTGHGKSTWATTGGRPMVILTETKAQSVLRQINPNAWGVVPESLEDLDALLVFLGQSEKLQAKHIDRIVLDSYTELTQALPRWIKQKMGPVGTLVKLEQSEFGSLQDYALAVVKAIQLTGYPSVIIGRSSSKKVGLAESIRPDSLGKSVEQLPGKLLPTAESRFDQELGYVIDTTPADHSQRCGLPWVPPIWSGSCLEFLQVVEAGPQGTIAPEPVAAPAKAARARKQPSSEDLPNVPAPGSNDDGWLTLMARMASATVGRPDQERKDQVCFWDRAYTTNPEKAKADLGEFIEATERLKIQGAPDPEVDPDGYKKVFGDMLLTMAAEKRAKDQAAPVNADAQAFVDAVAPPAANPEYVRDLLDLCDQYHVDLNCMWSYALSRKQALPGVNGSANWLSLTSEFCARILPQLKDADKRPTFISWLHKTHIPF